MNKIQPHSLFTDFDLDLFRAGKHFRLYEKMGSHPLEVEGKAGTYFAVYAPAAKSVGVIGNFNGWNARDHQLFVRWDGSGIWEGFLPGIGHGEAYKYQITSDHTANPIEKGDPFARFWEHPPRTATIIWDKKYTWKDSGWMKKRAAHNSLQAPMTVYEVHLASWKRKGENEYLTWEEMGQDLVDYCREMKFTHVEFMPVMEYPYDPSWGYQIVGYFAPTSRFGEPEGLKKVVDVLHQKGIGVLLDWVPSHFPSDAHGLAQFDGTHVYEHPDPRKGYHPDWKSLIFNYGRPEVRSFLISNALFWLDQYHADGLRVDAVASMLYLDYSRNHGEWEPNQYGGRENLDAILFMKDLNQAIYENYPDVQSVAEESTAFPLVTRPVEAGGLGFGQKWMMGWMHDTLEYFKKDPVYRQYHQGDLSNTLLYAFSESYVLPLSHDEVVHGKGSLLGRMPGDDWQRFANLRALYGWMYTHPGSKLLFMGGEFAQSGEWKFDRSLDWHLLDYAPHQGVQTCLKVLNQLYQKTPALYERAYSPEGFEWIDFQDSQNSVYAFIRMGNSPGDHVISILNLTPNTHQGYKLGCPTDQQWKVIFDSDDKKFGGSGHLKKKQFASQSGGWHGRSFHLELTLPPLACLILQPID
ncbi:MAG: 1,4-alpha-glucan branching protein GlgB [Bacteroidia bacterium]|nr:1,4-alpha-glucan branching protein GlgB [Bacteroidia bacterium]